MSRLAPLLVACGLVVGCDYEDPVAPLSFDLDAPVDGADPCATEAGVRALVFEPSCTNGACHDAERPKAGVDLATPGILARLSERTSVHGACSDDPIVVPGQPDAGLMLPKLLGLVQGCGDPMPPTGALSSEQLQCVARWIAAGEDDGP